MPDAEPLLDPQRIPPPLDYPFTAAVDDGLLLGNRVAPMTLAPGGTVGAATVQDGAGGIALDGLLRGRGLAPCERRVLVVAVGSNAAPEVMLRKFTGRSVSTLVPLIRCRVGGIGVGFSAHVSRQGFVAATPFADPGGELVLIGSLLDDDQLAALDATEPNYVRLRLDAAAYPLTILGSGERPAAWSVYDSIHGVLTIDDEPVRLIPQVDLHARLRAVESVAAIAGLGADAVAALASLQQEPVRDALKAHWRDGGHARPSGLR